MFFLQGVFCRACFPQNVPCLKFPCSPRFAIALSYLAQAAMKPRAVLEINVSQQTEICVSVTLGCVYHVCIPTFQSVYHMCVPPFSHSDVRFLRSFLDIILS